MASLLAIAAVGYLEFRDQRLDEVSDIRRQGVSLARTLSAVPYDQLIPGGQQESVFHLLHHNSSGKHFAYASIVDATGRRITEIAADGVIVPSDGLSAEPSAWMGERRLSMPGQDREVLEFHAPLLADGDLHGFVRLGFHFPTAGPSLKQLQLLGMMSLPVFLLAPLFYFLLRREIRPIQQANSQMSSLLQGEAFKRVEISASGELGDFMRRFNHFVGESQEKICALEEEQTRLVTSSKLLTYRKNRVETVLETLPEAVMILDESGAITFVNQKMAALFGVSTQVILEQPVNHWCDHADVLALLAKFQSDGKKRNFTDTIRFDFRASADRAIATKTYPLFSPTSPSASIGTLIVFRDETKEALARQARIDFVSHLSHELKSPLNVLALYSESLLSESGKSEEFRVEAANVIAAEVDRLSSLISGMLSITQIENGSLTPDRNLVKLNDVASDAFEEAKGLAADREFNFELDVPKEMNPVLVDKDLMRVAINNLLSNAVKYNRDGGLVRLTIDETEDAIQIRVEDTGIGVSEDEEMRIFEKFFRSEDERVQTAGGHGLGLALARQIVELHNGTLSLNRDRPEGTEFIINLWKESTAVRQAI